MKKKELAELEKLNKEMKLTDEVKEKIAKKALNNFLIALNILLLFIILMIAARNITKNITILIYKATSIALFIFTLILFEVAYKKDNDEIAIHGIEMFFLSIVTLLTPYIFIEKTSALTSAVGAYFMAYYILKNLVVYKKEKNMYIREKSDISEIIKKESQDPKVKEERNKLEGNEAPKKKRGRPRKVREQ